MRKLILQQQMSLDGFVADTKKDVGWAFGGLDDEYAAWGAPRLCVLGQGLAIFSGLKEPLHLRAVEVVPFKSGVVARHFLAA